MLNEILILILFTNIGLILAIFIIYFGPRVKIERNEKHEYKA